MALFAKWLSSTIGSATVPITSAIASNKFMGFYISNSATSGTSVGHYMRLYVTGAGGSGVAGRFYTDGTGVATGTMHGIQATCGIGESTSAGSVSGLGSGVYANVFFPNATVSGGTYAAINAELYSGGSSTNISATATSYIRFSDGGTTNKTYGYASLFRLEGFTSGTGSTLYTHTISTPGAAAGSIKINVAGTPYYLYFWAGEGS